MWKQWFPDGGKKSERTFSNGERDSVWTSWFENGNKKLQATYKNGKLNGGWTSWYEGGIIKEKTGGARPDNLIFQTDNFSQI